MTLINALTHLLMCNVCSVCEILSLLVCTTALDMLCLSLWIRGLFTLTDVALLNLFVGGRKKLERSNVTYFTSVRRHDEESLDVVLLQEGMPLMAKTGFHLIVSI